MEILALFCIAILAFVIFFNLKITCILILDI